MSVENTPTNKDKAALKRLSQDPPLFFDSSNSILLINSTNYDSSPLFPLNIVNYNSPNMKGG